METETERDREEKTEQERERQEKMKEKMKEKRREMKEEMILLKNVSEPSNPPRELAQHVSKKKNPFRTNDS